MSNFTFSQALGDLGSVNSLRQLNESQRPDLFLPCRNTAAGRQASLCGYGVIGANGIPVLTRLYAARIPNTSGAPNILRRNLDGKWISSAVPSAKIFYKGNHPSSHCLPGELFLKVTSTFPKGHTIPIHTVQVWDHDNMRWQFSRDVVPGIIGLLPINQGPPSPSVEHAAASIHPALFSAGFVVSSYYEEKFKLKLPEGFPVLTDTTVVDTSPTPFVEAFNTWTTAMAASVPKVETGDMRKTLAEFQRESDADIERLKSGVR